MDDQGPLRLLLEIADFGRFLTSETAKIQPARATGNVPVLILCSLELDGAQRPTNLAATTQLTTGRITQVVDELEHDGLVQRTADPADGRAVLVEITDAGSEVLMVLESTIVSALRTHPARVAAFRDTLSGLGPDDDT
ncbi:MAG: MarR family transcriptional regulator [Acidimicrobiia bacterium]